MFDFIMAGDNDFMDVILDGPHVPIKEIKKGDMTRMMVKTRRVFEDEYR